MTFVTKNQRYAAKKHLRHADKKHLVRRHIAKREVKDLVIIVRAILSPLKKCLPEPTAYIDYSTFCWPITRRTNTFMHGSSYNVIRSIWSAIFYIFHFLWKHHNSQNKIILLAFRDLCRIFKKKAFEKNSLQGKTVKVKKREKNNQISV